MRTLVIFIFLFYTTGCSVGNSTLTNNRTLKHSFTETELRDLEKLYSFFIDNICFETQNQDLTQCYESFFKRMEEAVDSGEFDLGIAFQEQMKIYNSFEDSTFFEIYSYGKSWYPREAPGDTFRSVYFNPNGKYMEFLKRTGRNDKIIQYYYEHVSAAGDIPPSIFWHMIASYQYYNIDDIRVKFIIAIHYLTLNDTYERREKIKTVANNS